MSTASQTIRFQNVSLKDIAARVGVSTMTVSRALTKSNSVSPAKRAAVLAAAEDLGYRPNPMVGRMMSDLRRRRAHAFGGTLAFLYASPEEEDRLRVPALRSLWQGARRRAEETGFALDHLWLKRPGLSPSRLRAVIHARGVRGLLLGPGVRPEALDFPLDSFALVSVAGPIFAPRVHDVLPDHFHNHLTCLRELHALGYVRVGLFATRTDLAECGEEALGGYLAAQLRAPGSEQVPLAADCESWAEAEIPFKHWVCRTRPDAIIANDPRARRWLRELGLECPRDIALALPSLAGEATHWSGIAPALEDQGVQAVDLLASQIFRNEQGYPALPRRITIRGRWVAGETTRTPATLAA